MMTSHGPETDVFNTASNSKLEPIKYPYENLAFMFETCYFLKTTEFVMDKEV